MARGQERNARGNLIKPSLQVVANWGRTAWEKISNETVQNALNAGYLKQGQCFEETYASNHARIIPLIRVYLQENNSDHQQIASSQDDEEEWDELASVE